MMMHKTLGCGLVFALVLNALACHAAAQLDVTTGRELLAPTATLASAATTAAKKAENNAMQYLTLYAPNLAQVFANSLATTPVNIPATGAADPQFVKKLADNFQKQLTDLSVYYDNLAKSLAAKNSTFGQRTVCDLGALFQAAPSLFSGSNANPALAGLVSSSGATALNKLLTNGAYATQFNKECKLIKPESGSLSTAVTSLLGDNAIAQQVQNAIANLTASGAAASKVPKYLLNTTIGKYLQAVQSTGSSPSSAVSSGLARQLLTTYLQSLGSFPTTAAGNPSHPIADAVKDAFAAAPSTVASAPRTGALATELKNLLQTAAGGKK